MPLTVDEVDELVEALLDHYTGGRNRSVGVAILPEAMKRPEMRNQLADWRARKLVVRDQRFPSVIRLTDDGFLYFRDRWAALKQMP